MYRNIIFVCMRLLCVDLSCLRDRFDGTSTQHLSEDESSQYTIINPRGLHTHTSYVSTYMCNNNTIICTVTTLLPYCVD